MLMSLGVRRGGFENPGEEQSKTNTQGKCFHAASGAVVTCAWVGQTAKTRLGNARVPCVYFFGMRNFHGICLSILAFWSIGFGCGRFFSCWSLSSFVELLADINPQFGFNLRSVSFSRFNQAVSDTGKTWRALSNLVWCDDCTIIRLEYSE